MCIAILKTKKGKITDDALRNSFNRNSDGAGIAYTIDNKLIIEKGIFDVNQFIKAVRRIEAICDNNMLIHCRIGTSGKKDKENTHPFSVSENVCLIHNGILDIEVPKESDKNDTRLFIERYLKEVSDYDLLHNNCIKKMITTLIGNGNKFILMDNKGYYRIINEKAGHWKDDVWYSNTSYQQPAYNWSGYYGYDYSYDYSPYLTKKECEALEKIINKLSTNDIINLGYEPVYSFKYGCLLNDEYIYSHNEFFKESEYAYLSDISWDLYSLYLDKLEIVDVA